MSFKNTIIIMTSNLGSAEILAHDGEVEQLKESLNAELRRHFRPEFLNRIDEVLIFHRLEKAEIVKIVDIQLARLAKRLKDQDIEMDVTDAAKHFIADAGYDPSFGARPLKRAIIRLVETPLSRKLLAGEIPPGKLAIDVKGGELTFTPGE